MYPFYEIKDDGNKDYITMWQASNLSFPPHLHPHVELIYVKAGTITVFVNSKSKVLHPGEMAVIFPNDVHSYNTDDLSEEFVIIFSPNIVSSYFSDKKNKTLENPFIDKDSIENTTILLLNMLQEEYLNSNSPHVIKGYLYSILGKLDCHFSLINSKYSYDSTIQSVLRYIEGHYTENITLDILSRDLGFSRYYLSRLFKQKIGYQLNDYVNRLRFNMSKRLLLETDMSIGLVALECGFDSLRNFNRVFRQHAETTPSEYRKNIKK